MQTLRELQGEMDNFTSINGMFLYYVSQLIEKANKKKTSEDIKDLNKIIKLA